MFIITKTGITLDNSYRKKLSDLQMRDTYKRVHGNIETFQNSQRSLSIRRG